MTEDTPEFDAYRVLGLEPGAGPAEIRAAFRRRVQERHPDTAPSQTTPASVQEVVEAYRILMDPASRARYEAERARPGPGGRRIPVRRGPRSDPVSTPPAATPCSTCRGAGRVTTAAPCDRCAGTGEVTVIDTSGARRLSCRTCAGRGRRDSVRICPRCRGSGLND